MSQFTEDIAGPQSQAAWVQDAIARGNEFHFKRQRPLLHNALNLSLFTKLLTSVAFVLGAAEFVHAAIYIPLAGLALGLLFFTLLILVVHEASHGMFLISRNPARARFWNRVFGWIVSVPFAIHYSEHWEKGHRIHHFKPMEKGDPQAFNLLTGSALAAMLLKMILIPGYVFFWNPSRKYANGFWLVPTSVLFWLTVGYLALQTASWASLPAMLLGFQVLGALNQLKGSLEHGGDIAFESNRNFRSRTSLFALRWVLMPLNISLHFEHHLNCNVPWYALGRYHAALRGLVPEVLGREVFNTHVWAQLMGRKGGLSESARAAATNQTQAA